MANTGSYSMCMRGTDEAIEELRALLNSDAFPSIYGCDNFGFDEPNRFNGEFNGSFLNSVDIYDEESLFRSTVAQLGLEVEVYGQEVGSSYEEHFVIEGDSLTVDEQDGNAFDEPIADLTLDEIDEIAKTYGMGASRDAVIKAYDNGNIRFGGYEWNFNFAPARALQALLSDKKDESTNLSEKSKEIILSIREYEDSVEMPKDERITCLDSDRKVHLIAGNDKAQDFAGYAAECQEYLRFGDDIDLASAGGLERFAYLKISDTPQILLAAGFEQKPMLYTQNHLREALKPKSNNHPHRHGFTIAQIKRWPELFKKPVILADNPSRDDALLVVLCAVDNDKLPLIASIKPDGKGHYELETVETNLVLTVFGKDNFMNYFQGALTPDKIVYIDKKQGQKLERLAERQLFGNYSSLSPNTIIHQPKCIDKIKSAGQQTKEEAQDMDLSGMVNKVRDASEHKRDDNKVSRNEPKHEIDPR